jgi:hypothetical protein
MRGDTRSILIVVYNGGECDFNDDKTVLNIEGEA